MEHRNKALALQLGDILKWSPSSLRVFKSWTFAEVNAWVGMHIPEEHLAYRKQVARELVVHVLGERNGAVQA